ncbi:hypothetical protein OSB04_008002 [Centaurea solstitialis]|uniref:Uncharacterized protein n=1 Tax=Centaurea solstitialis TaxID=347529 RepID=A0AA38U474_9ASTR|nr:hypothetical protein OSB04_008002 [Centaurea solstitialis]
MDTEVVDFGKMISAKIMTKRPSYGELPFSYLGISVGRNMRKIESWKEKTNRKLEIKINLIRGETYFGSITFPRGVIGELENVRSDFFLDQS